MNEQGLQINDQGQINDEQMDKGMNMNMILSTVN